MTEALLGAGHRALVDRLIATLTTIKDGDLGAPRVVVLVGASGTGKSRIVREVYRRLQARQTGSAYWPPLPEQVGQGGHGAGTDPMPDRKILGPPLADFMWPADALPAFGWWVFDCDRSPRGDLLEVVTQARPTIQAHLVPVRLAWQEAAGWPGRLQGKRGEIVNRFKEALAEGGVEAADLLCRSMDVAVPGLGLGISWLHQGVGAMAADHAERTAFHSEVRLSGNATEEKRSAAAELAEMIAAVAHPEVPAIVVVEDLHLMGPDLATFLTNVAQRRNDHPVLVIGTAWSEGQDNPVYDHWRRSPAIAGNLDVVQMPDLNPVDLVEMLWRYAPNTDEVTASQVVARYPNPLALLLFLTLHDTQDQISRAGGRVQVSDEELGALPYTIRGLYELRWAELPAAVHTALSYAAGTLPVGDYAWSYTPQVVMGAVGRAGLPEDVAEVGSALTAAVTSLGWAVSDGVTGQRFRESILGEIAFEHLTPKSKRAQLRSAAHDFLEEVVEERRGTGYFIEPAGEELHAASWLTSLTPSGSNHSPAEAVAVVAVARALASAYKPAAAADTLLERRWAVGLDPDHPSVLTIYSLLAGWLREAGRVGDAVAAFEQLLSDRRRVLGSDHPDTLTTRSNLAFSRAEAGRVGEAIAAFQQILADRQRVLGPDHPDTLTTRSNLARWLASVGRVDEAVVALEQLLIDQQRVEGVEHLSTLRTRGNLASCYGESGRVDEAIVAFEQLLDVEQRVLGPDDPSTLITRNNLACWIRATGRVNDAITAFEQLLIDQLRILGTDAPDTLLTRHNLASAHGEAGQVDEAIATFEQLLTDQQRVLGYDHPYTLNTRSSLAATRRAAGQLEGAIAALKQLLVDQQRVLGRDHPYTLATRSDLALCRGEAGQVAEAIAALEQLFIDQQRVLAPDDPRTFRTRVNLASLIGEAGRVDDAIAAFQQLLTDQQRVLGYDHPETLGSRNNLASWLAEAGRVDDDMTGVFERLLSDCQRVLGPDHPHTFMIRINLAYTFSQTGRIDDALAAYGQLLGDQQRILGPDHPNTLLTHNNLACCLRESGRLDDAITAFKQLLSDHQRVQGPDHPDTVSVRDNLAYLLRERQSSTGANRRPRRWRRWRD